MKSGILIFRQEPWGRVAFDLEGDDLWAEVRAGAPEPRIDRPLSATCLLNQGAAGESPDGSPVPQAVRWSANLDRLRAAGFLRLSLVGLESLPRSEALEFVQDAYGRGIGVIGLAGDCTDDLKAISGLLTDLSIQILFQHGHAWRTEGELGLTRRLEVLRQLTETGLSVKVLTSYDPASPMMLTELGEKLERAGIRKWLIYPPPSSRRAPHFTEAALEEIRGVARDIPWLEVRYGSFLERELGLLIFPDGKVVARQDGPPIEGSVDRLAAGQLLPRSFLDRHVNLWVSGRIEYEEGSGWEDPILERSERPEIPDHQVFLCYSRGDRKFALSLHHRMKAAGIPIWMDDIKLAAGDHWQPETEKALAQSQVVVICVGPSGVGDFQQREMEVALKLESEGALKVIPVILPGVPGELAIPPFLRTLHYVDFRRPDINPFQRLISGILRSLRQEEDPTAAAEIP